MCHYYSKTPAPRLVSANMLMSDMPGVFLCVCVLFKVCQEVHRGECVSSPLNPEPLVSHHLTNLPPPRARADQATKAPSSRRLHRALQASAVRLETVQSFLPTSPPASANKDACTCWLSSTLYAPGDSIRQPLTWVIRLHCVYACDC